MATVKGGFFAQYSGTYLTNQSGKSASRRTAAKFLDSIKAFQEIAQTLDGVAPGAAALWSYKRIRADETLGGRRVIETVSPVNRVTTAADVTEVNNDLMTYGGIIAAPPPNLDRNPLGWR